MNVNLYPEMNQKIVQILRISDEPSCQYAAALIESLQAQLTASQRKEKAAVADIWNASMNAPCAVCANGFANTGAPCTVYPCKFEWRGPQEAER